MAPTSRKQKQQPSDLYEQLSVGELLKKREQLTKELALIDSVLRKAAQALEPVVKGNGTPTLPWGEIVYPPNMVKPTGNPPSLNDVLGHKPMVSGPQLSSVMSANPPGSDRYNPFNMSDGISHVAMLPIEDTMQAGLQQVIDDKIREVSARGGLNVEPIEPTVASPKAASNDDYEGVVTLASQVSQLGNFTQSISY